MIFFFNFEFWQRNFEKKLSSTKNEIDNFWNNYEYLKKLLEIKIEMPPTSGKLTNFNFKFELFNKSFFEFWLQSVIFCDRIFESWKFFDELEFKVGYKPCRRFLRTLEEAKMGDSEKCVFLQILSDKKIDLWLKTKVIIFWTFLENFLTN